MALLRHLYAWASGGGELIRGGAAAGPCSGCSIPHQGDGLAIDLRRGIVNGAGDAGGICAHGAVAGCSC